jgi:hypothetical protein
VEGGSVARRREREKRKERERKGEGVDVVHTAKMGEDDKVLTQYLFHSFPKSAESSELLKYDISKG